MIGLVLGETQFGNLIIKKLKLLKKKFVIIDISKKKIFKKNKNFFPLSIGQLGKAISILKKGGNAVDAAIAASAVQSVIEPGSTGVGGDCFALISLNGKNPVSVNGSGIAPKKATLEYFDNDEFYKFF